jgi:hypothetical protein
MGHPEPPLEALKTFNRGLAGKAGEGLPSWEGVDADFGGATTGDTRSFEGAHGNGD